MKKTFFLSLLAFFCAAGLLQAQVGAKAGVNFSGVGSYGNSEEGESVGLKPGFQVGALYKMEVNDKLGLMLELNYERRGTVSKKDYTINLPVTSDGSVLGIGSYAIKQEANSEQHYINLPILLTFGGETLRFYAGPNVGYMITGKAKFDRTIDVNLGGNPVASTKLELEDVDWFDYDSFKDIFVTAPPENGDFLNRLELGINLGAMYQITEAIFADLRVSQGLTDVSNNDYDNSIYPNENFQFESREDTDRNLSIQLSFGYMF